jgi:GT2 family glycosyltransferase
VSASAPLPATVIIPTRDRSELVVDSVRSILSGAEVPREVVIVDQSREVNRPLAEMGTVRGCTIRYQRTASRGVSAARNEACALATEDVLVFTDDDVFVDPEWLGTMVRLVLADPTSALISGRVLAAEDGRTGGFAPSLTEGDEPKVYEGRVWADVLFSNNMGFGRAVYDGLGPFDERLGVGGPYRAATDNDYGFRALAAGHTIRFSSDAVVYHRAWRPMSDHPRLMWAYGVGQGAFLTKHARLNDRHTLTRLRKAVARRTGLALRERKANRDLALGHATYALGLLYGAARWYALERLRGR